MEKPENAATPSTNPVVFSLCLPWPQINASYQKKLDAYVASTKLDGFRDGKAPRSVVEEKIGKKTIVSELIEALLPAAYREEISKLGISPMIAPRVKPISLEEGKDWEFEVAVVTRPNVSLDGLTDKLKEALAPGKIVVPGKQEEQTKEQKMKVAFDTILEVAKVELPNLLVEEKVNSRLAQLVDQLQSLGLTVEQYLSSKRLSAAELRHAYEQTARETLILNLSLDELARKRGFTGKDRISQAVDWLMSH